MAWTLLALLRCRPARAKPLPLPLLPLPQLYCHSCCYCHSYCSPETLCSASCVILLASEGWGEGGGAGGGAGKSSPPCRLVIKLTAGRVRRTVMAGQLGVT